MSETAEEAKKTEGKGIVAELAKLKYELQHDRKLTYVLYGLNGGIEADMYSPLPNDGKADIEGYNKELEQLGNPQWFNVPWLYAECYLYRYAKLYFRKGK